MVTFNYTNSYPKDNIKVYGKTQTLQSTVTISGIEEPYYYDTDFYLGGQKIVTVSGTSSGEEVATIVTTASGVNYSWYIETTSSGVSDNSPNYSFYVRYLCSGICEVNDVVVSGVNIHLHRRSSGELIGETTTAGTGTFTIDSSFNEDHYAVALHPDTNFNALIFDKIKP